MASFLDRVAAWISPPAPPRPCPQRHWDISDQVDLDDARKEISRLTQVLDQRPGAPPCDRQHCDARHWTDADQEYVNSLLAQINQTRYDLEAERLKASPLPEVKAALLMRAKELTDGAEHTFPAGFGEARRHDVLARLRKEFPCCPQRHAALAIELTLPPEAP